MISLLGRLSNMIRKDLGSFSWCLPSLEDFTIPALMLNVTFSNILILLL